MRSAPDSYTVTTISATSFYSAIRTTCFGSRYYTSGSVGRFGDVSPIVEINYYAGRTFPPAP